MELRMGREKLQEREKGIDRTQQRESKKSKVNEKRSTR